MYLFIHIVLEITIIIIIIIIIIITLIIETAVPVTHNLPKTKAQEITKYIFALEIRNIWKLNNNNNNNNNNNTHTHTHTYIYIYIYIPHSHLSGRNGHQKVPKISAEYRVNQKHLKSGAKKPYYYKLFIQYSNS